MKELVSLTKMWTWKTLNKTKKVFFCKNNENQLKKQVWMILVILQSTYFF